MHKQALEVLDILEEHGFTSYIVGGYVRDYLLGKKTIDIDICTNAKPKEIMGIFDTVTVSEAQYGSVTVFYKKLKFDITTFRKEIKYESNRKPIKIKYINDIKKDLLRRDFTINTLCMNSDGEILDVLNIKEDLRNKLIKTVGNPRYKLKEDSLRILRAIRFATILDFEIDKKTCSYLTKYNYLLRKLSYFRKKEELNKIFSSINKEKGRELLLRFKSYKYLELDNLKDIILCDDIIGIWSQLNVDNIYPFNKIEKEQMKNIRYLLSLKEIDNYTLYKYGLYLCSVVYDIEKKERKGIVKLYSDFPIHSVKEINIKQIEIANILGREPGSYIKEILLDIEKRIINNELENNYVEIEQYIKKNYN